MLEFWEFVYMCIFVLVILVLKEIIEYVFITRKGGNVITIEETQFSKQTNEVGMNTRFKKKKSGKDDKIIEGFFSCPGPVPADDAQTCEKAQWLFCDINFNTLKDIINTPHPKGGYYASYTINSINSLSSELPPSWKEVRIEKHASSVLPPITGIYFRDNDNKFFRVHTVSTPIASSDEKGLLVIEYGGPTTIFTQPLATYGTPNVTLNSIYHFYIIPQFKRATYKIEVISTVTPETEFKQNIELTAPSPPPPTPINPVSGMYFIDDNGKTFKVQIVDNGLLTIVQYDLEKETEAVNKNWATITQKKNYDFYIRPG